ncbi:hypothetical protein DWQ67_01415 [Galactobacter caseinivorans]|uniref:DUF559 domain-containing protein n=1 Tax=Galactobacter caseinivorans TaxID=2676123 RepID=A0A496PM02_9MICC|nr:hypothetical protein DWQ67_01415 [Galactobacter caseinivorans]
MLAEGLHLNHPEIVFAGASSLELRGLPVLNYGLAIALHRDGRPRRMRRNVVSGGQALTRYTVETVDFAPLDDGADRIGNWRCESLEAAAVRVVTGVETGLSAAVLVLDGAWWALGAGPDGRAALERAAVGLPGVAVSRFNRAMDLASPLSESAAESLARVAMWELGFQLPAAQVELLIEGRLVRPDFLWPGQLILEVDGEGKYAGPDEAQSRRAEKQRQLALERAGYRVARAEWADVINPQRFRGVLARLGVPPAERQRQAG